MTIDMSEVNLDAPAFGAEAQKVEDTTETPITEPSQAESGEKSEEQPSSGGEPVEEQKVPYSRLKSVIDRAREAERIAEEANERLEQLMANRNQGYEAPRENQSVSAYQGSLPVWWTKMYGDNDVSREAYSYELQRQDAIREEVRREAIEAVRAERTQETQMLAQNERTIDERVEDLSYSLGRELTEQEELALLEIVDEYTPKDRDGNYSGDIIPMDKAWEIYNLQRSQTENRSQTKRKTATALTSARTDGEPSPSSNSAPFNPRDWNAYRKRIPQ